MQKYKSSPYNLLIPIEETNQFLLFNTLSGGLEVLSDDEGICLAELMTLRSFSFWDEQISEKVKNNHSKIEEWINAEYIIPEDKDIVLGMKEHTSSTQYKNPKTINITIGTTITCNMGCAYCFEFVKPNLTLKDTKVKKRIIEYVEEIIIKMDNTIEELNVVWYGGEPLINVNAIKDLSEGFSLLVEKYNLKYSASIITNGIYLTEENAKTLVECKVKNVQVTIDGAAETHNRKRPLKQRSGENYEKIIKNFVALPSELKVVVRINVDKEVSGTLSRMLEDFQKAGIWPQRYNQFSFDAAWLRAYNENLGNDSLDDLYMNIEEFFDFKQSFRLMQRDRFQEWAGANNIQQKSKFKWVLPEFQHSCGTWASPLGFVIDPEGAIHKCWETIHDSNYAPTSIFNEFSFDDFAYYSSYNRYNHHPVCSGCKFLPCCDKLSCAFDAIKTRVPNCTQWKYKAEEFIKQQYLRLVKDPKSINYSSDNKISTGNLGHANK